MTTFKPLRKQQLLCQLCHNHCQQMSCLKKLFYGKKKTPRSLYGAVIGLVSSGSRKTMRCMKSHVSALSKYKWRNWLVEKSILQYSLLMDIYTLWGIIKMDSLGSPTDNAYFFSLLNWLRPYRGLR